MISFNPEYLEENSTEFYVPSIIKYGNPIIR